MTLYKYDTQDVSDISWARNEDKLNEAFELSSVKKMVNFLQQEAVLSQRPRDVAAFLREHKNRIGLTEIGDYLGEEDTAFKEQLRLSYVSAIAFAGIPFEQAIRSYLCDGGFRLPGMFVFLLFGNHNNFTS